MPRFTRLAALVLLALATNVSSAVAHDGNPDFRSIVNAVTPALPGVKVQVLGSDSFMQLTSTAKQAVTVYGYDGEPYLRLLPDGTVQRNRLSPATYLNEDRFGGTPVPKFANADAAPQWVTVDHSGKLIWHDHRMHWMAKTVPSIVKDKAKRTKVFNYKITVGEGSQKAQIRGTLFWQGVPKGFQGWAYVSIGVLALLGLAFVVVVRRRRGPGDPGAPDAPDPTAKPATEAW